MLTSWLGLLTHRLGRDWKEDRILSLRDSSTTSMCPLQSSLNLDMTLVDGSVTEDGSILQHTWLISVVTSVIPLTSMFFSMLPMEEGKKLSIPVPGGERQVQPWRSTTHSMMTSTIGVEITMVSTWWLAFEMIDMTLRQRKRQE